MEESGLRDGVQGGTTVRCRNGSGGDAHLQRLDKIERPSEDYGGIPEKNEKYSSDYPGRNQNTACLYDLNPCQRYTELLIDASKTEGFEHPSSQLYNDALVLRVLTRRTRHVRSLIPIALHLRQPVHRTLVPLRCYAE